MKKFLRLMIFLVFVIFSFRFGQAWRGAGLINSLCKGMDPAEGKYYGQRCYFNSVLQILSKIKELNGQVVAFVDSLELNRDEKGDGAESAYHPDRSKSSKRRCKGASRSAPYTKKAKAGRSRRRRGACKTVAEPCATDSHCIPERPVDTISGEQVCLLKNYRRLIDGDNGSLRDPECTVNAIETYKAAIRAFFPGTFGNPRQQDAADFLTHLLDNFSELRSELRNADGDLFLVVEGLHFSCSRESCPGYDDIKPDERMPIVRVQIPDEAVSLSDCLNCYFSEEPIDAHMECRVEGCLGTRTHMKRGIFSLGQYLFVQLKRFNYDSATGEKTKISNAVSCPMGLDLNPYYCGYDSTGLKNYELFGFIVHGGETLDRGHYWAYVKDSVSETPDTPWTCYNDEAVRPISNTDVEAIAGAGEVAGGQIYIAVYKRVNDVVLVPASDDSPPEAKRQKLDDQSRQEKKKDGFGCILM
jgi:ubiquitin C-terminal hydrolase